MIILYAGLLVLGCILLFLSRREEGEKGKKMGGFLPFYRAGKYLCRKIKVLTQIGKSGSGTEKSKTGYEKNAAVHKRADQDIKEALAFLYPGEDGGKSMECYRYRKAGYMVCIYFAAVLTACAVYACGENGVLLDGGRIERMEYQGGEVEAELIAEVGGQAKPLTVKVSERSYTQKELEEQFNRLLPVLDEIVKGENTQIQAVRKNLRLPDRVEGFPFSISWESGDYELVGADGTVNGRGADEEGELVGLRAMIRCGGFERDYRFYVNVLPPSYSDQEKLEELLLDRLEGEDKDSANENYFKLPSEVNGWPVVWKEKNGSGGLEALGAFAAAALLVWFALDKDLKKSMEQKEKELLEEYPEVVSRLTLFIGAGMTVQAAFRKTAEQGKGSAKAVYQEMLTACNEMDAGVPESQAYMRFGRRCRLKEYRRFGMLLTQNLKKGARGLLPRLQEESRTALQEKKAEAVRLGEEAGTKLLLPMTGMLVFVMIVIIVPAFGSF